MSCPVSSPVPCPVPCPCPILSRPFLPCRRYRGGRFHICRIFCIAECLRFLQVSITSTPFFPAHSDPPRDFIGFFGWHGRCNTGYPSGGNSAARQIAGGFPTTTQQQIDRTVNQYRVPCDATGCAESQSIPKTQGTQAQACPSLVRVWIGRDHGHDSRLMAKQSA